MKQSVVVAGVVVVGAIACSVTQVYESLDAVVDRDDWALHVQPYVAPRCATVDCHGDPRRPLRIYSVEGLRDVSDRELPLTRGEIDANVDSALGLAPSADAEAHALVLEPLSTSAGGWHHAGEDIWLSRDDPGYLCLYLWLRGADPSESCATAAASIPRGSP